MREYQIWEKEYYGQDKEHERGGMLIPVDEIIKKVYTEDMTACIIEGIMKEHIDSLNYLLNDNIIIEDEDGLKEFLIDNNINFTDVRYTHTYENPNDNIIYYDYNSKEFGTFDDFDSYDTYEWWDGSNWKLEFCGEEITVTQVTIEDNPCQNLDEWDGNNFCTGNTRFYHEEVYRIIKLDEEETEDKFLVLEWSQWQGDHQTGKVMTKDELEKHIEDINNLEE